MTSWDWTGIFPACVLRRHACVHGPTPLPDRWIRVIEACLWMASQTLFFPFLSAEKAQKQWLTVIPLILKKSHTASPNLPTPFYIAFLSKAVCTRPSALPLLCFSMKLSLPGFPGNHWIRRTTSAEVMSSCVLQSTAMLTCTLLFLDQPTPSDTPQRCGGLHNCTFNVYTSILNVWIPNNRF